MHPPTATPARAVLGVLAAALALSCGPCGLQPDAGIKIVVPAMPTTLDPNTSDPTSWSNFPVMLATLRGLTTLSPDNRVEPGLAARWEQARTPDGREVYTFHLREDVRWSSGAPLVAQDFVLGWRRAVVGKEKGDLSDLLGADAVIRAVSRGAPEAEVAALLDGLEVRALDPRTLRVVLAHPRSYFLSRLANVYLFFPAPSAELEGKGADAQRESYDRPRDGRPSALGSFRVERWDRAGERLRLVANPASAFSPPPDGQGGQVPPVVTLLKSEIGTALYERGRVDFVFVDSALALRAPPPPDLQRQQLLGTYFLAFNTLRPPLDAPEVRRALARALDREALLAGLLPFARVSNELLPPDLPGAATREEAARLPRFDPAAARAALQAHGGVSRRLRLVYRAGESFIPEVAIAERIQAQLARVGVAVDVEPRADFSAEVERRAPDGFPAPDLYLRRLGADYAHPKSFFSLFERDGNHHTGWERAEGGAAIDRFEALLARGDAAEDPAEARKDYAAAQEILLDEQVVLAPLYHPDRYFRARPGLRGLGVDPFNFLSLRDLRVVPMSAAVAR